VESCQLAAPFIELEKLKRQMNRNNKPPLRHALSILLNLSVVLLVNPLHQAWAQDQDLVDQSIVLGQYTFPVKLPAGFTVELLSHDLEVPRILHFHGERLFIGSRSGKVYWMDPPYTEPNVLLQLADYPHSVVVHNDAVYIAQTSSISKAPYSHTTTSIDINDLEHVTDLPGGRGHNSRTLKLGPDHNLYVSLGISGNCSDEYLDSSYPADLQRGGVFQIDLDSTKAQLIPFASGLRNPVGLGWHPETKQWYASNNGPDHRGFNSPHEVFAQLSKGSFHGMPWFVFEDGDFVADDCIPSETPRPVESISRPVATFPARIAPMDLTFIDNKTKAVQFENDALVALHGSWATLDGGGSGDPASRREPKIVRVDFTAGKAGKVYDFMLGFQLPDGNRWARPMGIATGPDGHIYFSSDDGIQGLYRIRYTP